MDYLRRHGPDESRADRARAERMIRAQLETFLGGTDVTRDDW